MTILTSRHPLPGQTEIFLRPSPRQSVGWQEAALCRQADPELFFPVGSTGPAVAEIQRAKAVCARCPVREPCLIFALATSQQYGIWGGCDENERAPMLRQWRKSALTQAHDEAASLVSRHGVELRQAARIIMSRSR